MDEDTRFRRNSVFGGRLFYLLHGDGHDVTIATRGQNKGRQVVFKGTHSQIIHAEQSITQRYLA
jgi:hypothetical protein